MVKVMKLHLLGTGGYHPSGRRQTACLMIPELGLVLDAGTAMFRVREHLQTDWLDIFLTHAHLDHCVGLTYLIDVAWQKSIRRITVHAEAEKIEAIQKHLLSPLLFPAKLPCEFRPLGQDYVLPDGGQEMTVVRHFPLEHPGGVVGYRVDWPDRSLAYVTDTMAAAADAAYLEAIHGVDLLVHECYFPDSLHDRAELTGHSCTSDVAQLAAAAGVGRCVLVHINPLADDDDLGLVAAREIFAPLELAMDGQVVEI